MLQQQEGPSLFTLRGPVRGMIIQGISGRRLPARPAAPDFTSLVGLCLLHPLAFCCFFLRFFLGIHTPTPPLTPGPLPPPPAALPSPPSPALRSPVGGSKNSCPPLVRTCTNATHVCPVPSPLSSRGGRRSVKIRMVFDVAYANISDKSVTPKTPKSDVPFTSSSCTCSGICVASQRPEYRSSSEDPVRLHRRPKGCSLALECLLLGLYQALPQTSL